MHPLERDAARCSAGAGRRRLFRTDGQALVETGIVIVLLVVLSMGVIEFGRAWMVGNMITHAARDGARAAALTPASNRNDAGIIQSTAAVESLVEGQIATVLSSSVTVAVTQGTASGLPVVTVNVTADVPYIFNLVGSDFSVNRSVTFRDEGR
jgi:Flp pilus assembly protein TadG